MSVPTGSRRDLIRPSALKLQSVRHTNPDSTIHAGARARKIEQPSYFYSDNPIADRDKLRSIFGSSLRLLADPFHLLYNLGHAVSSQHVAHRKFLEEMSNAFFVQEATDRWLLEDRNRREFEEWQQRMRGIFETDKKFIRLFKGVNKSDGWFKKRVRRLIPDRRALEVSRLSVTVISA